MIQRQKERHAQPRQARSLPRVCHIPARGIIALFACIGIVIVGAATAQSSMAANGAQKFRICVFNEDDFRAKDVKLYVAPAPGRFDEIRAKKGVTPDCAGGPPVWEFEITNTLGTANMSAVVELKFKSELPSASPQLIDSKISLPLRLFAPTLIPNADAVVIRIGASVPPQLGTKYLDTLDRMIDPQDQVTRLLQAAVLYDYLAGRFGSDAKQTRRAAVILMNTAVGLARPGAGGGDSLFLIPEFVIQRIEESFGEVGYAERLRRRLVEVQTAPITVSQDMIEQLLRNGQCDAARKVLVALTAYVDGDTSLLAEARVSETHLTDLGSKISSSCSG